MRGKIILIFLILNSAFGIAQEAEFSFENRVHKFPRTQAGKQLKHTYYFTNIGESPIMITDVKVSCMCTRYKFPLKPVQPGARDSITVYFDTEGKKGYQDRTLEIYSNANPSPEKIRFKVFVKK